MIDSNSILYIIYFFGAYTLFHTYQNDYCVFLLTVLLMLGALWCYLYINGIIDKWENKIENVQNLIKDKIDFLSAKLFNMKNLANIKDFAQEKLNFHPSTLPPHSNLPPPSSLLPPSSILPSILPPSTKM